MARRNPATEAEETAVWVVPEHGEPTLVRRTVDENTGRIGGTWHACAVRLRDDAHQRYQDALKANPLGLPPIHNLTFEKVNASAPAVPPTGTDYTARRDQKKDEDKIWGGHDACWAALKKEIAKETPDFRLITVRELYSELKAA